MKKAKMSKIPTHIKTTRPPKLSTSFGIEFFTKGKHGEDNPEREMQEFLSFQKFAFLLYRHGFSIAVSYVLLDKNNDCFHIKTSQFKEEITQLAAIEMVQHCAEQSLRQFELNNCIGHGRAAPQPEPTHPTPTAPVRPAGLPQALLRHAADVIDQRGLERDTTATGLQQERSMAATVAAFNAIEGTQLTERQGWAFMQTLKLVRAASTARNGRYNADDYLDGAAYAALGAESAAQAEAA